MKQKFEGQHTLYSKIYCTIAQHRNASLKQNKSDIKINKWTRNMVSEKIKIKTSLFQSEKSWKKDIWENIPILDYFELA